MIQSMSVFIVLQIDIFILDAAPQTLDENIVQGASTPVHTYANTMFLQHFGKLGAGKLRPLIGIENMRQSFFCGFSRIGRA